MSVLFRRASRPYGHRQGIHPGRWVVSWLGVLLVGWGGAACVSSSPHLGPSPTPKPSPVPLPQGIVVDAGNPGAEISPYVYGVNYGPWMVVPYELMPQAEAAGFTFMRFPGGNWGDQYDLKPYHIDAFIRLARRLGATPSISVRLRGGTPEQAAALVRYTNRTRGYNVRFWSIGNEPSLYPDYDTQRFNVEWRAFAQAMRAVDPTIRLIGPDIHQFTGNPDEDPKDRAGRDWLRAFLEANGDLVDVVSIHRYPFPKCNTCPPATVADLRMNAYEWDILMPALRQVVHATTGRDLPIAVTEVNSHWSGAIGQESTPDGFYNAIWWADVLGRLLHQQVYIVAYFALQTPSGSGGWGLLSSRDVRPTYYMYRLYRHFGRTLVPVEVTAPFYDVSAYAALRDDGVLTLLVVNRGYIPHTVPLTVVGAQVKGPVAVWRLDRSHAAEQITSHPFKNGMTFTFPGPSVTLFILPLSPSPSTSFP